MKRLFVTLGLAVMLISNSSFASSDPQDALSTFYKKFGNAENVTWSDVDGMTRIGFTIHGQEQFAYYNNNDLVVLAKRIDVTELPSSLQKELSSHYGDYTKSELYAVESNGGKEYYITLDNSSKHLVLRGIKKWAVFLKEKK